MKAGRRKVLVRPVVLMVESDVLVRRPIAEYLRDCGYKVVESGSTDEALLILTAAAVIVEVVLADARAPGEQDGFALARWVRQNRPGVHVILAGTVAAHAKEAADLCEDGPHLAKPYDPQLLVDRIKRGLAARDRAKGR